MPGLLTDGGESRVSVSMGLDDQAFGRARGEVMAAHDVLRRGASSLTRSARDLLGDGWRGVAAGQVARAWDEWEEGVQDILGSLIDLVAAMDTARGGLLSSDGEAAGRATAVRVRLDALT